MEPYIGLVKVAIFGVATPYAWELVETLRRLDKSVICIDNLHQADSRLPNLVEAADRSIDFIVVPASPAARSAASAAAFNAGYRNLISVIDPTSIIASTAKIHHGVYVNAAATIASHSKIDCGAHVNRSASIGHDVVIGKYASIGPGAVIGSFAQVNLGAFIGTGAVILPKIVIGENAIVGAGAVVTKDVAPNEVVVGNPATFLKSNTTELSLQTCPW